MPIQLHDIVDRFYRAALGTADWAEALSGLASAVGADVCLLVSHDFMTGRGRPVHAFGLDEAALAAYKAEQAVLWFRHPRYFDRAPAVVDGSDLVDGADLAVSDCHRIWIEPDRLTDHKFVVLDRAGDRVVVLHFARAEPNGPFSTEDALLMKQLAPHIHYATTVAERARAAEVTDRSVIGALEAMPIGVALLNAAGGVIKANRLARTVIEAGEGIFVANGGLAVESGGRRVKMRDLIAQIADERSAKPTRSLPLSLSRRSGLRPLTVLVVAVDDRDDFDEAAVAVLYIGDPDYPVTFDSERIAKLYGLSRAESRVAALLASGYRLEQAAEMLGVAYETVRKHLKQIFSKTGTFRQAELVRILVSGPAGINL
jgi:DNA-binding CsgD family transcriptional regulator/PAS domain-containing protein